MQLNTAHALYPYLKHLICVDTDNVVKDIKDPGTTVTLDANVTIIPDAGYGRAFRTLRNGASGSYGINLSPAINIASDDTATGRTFVFVVFNSYVAQTSYGNFSGTSSAFRIYSDNKIRLDNTISNNGQWAISSGTVPKSSFAAPVPFSVGVSRAGNTATSNRIWINGVQDAASPLTNANGHAGWSSAGITMASVGGGSDTSFGAIEGDIVFIAVFQGKIPTDQEVADLQSSLTGGNAFALIESTGLSINTVVEIPVSQFNLQPVLTINSVVDNPVSNFFQQSDLSINSIVEIPVSQFNMQPQLSINSVVDNPVSSFNMAGGLSINSVVPEFLSSFSFDIIGLPIAINATVDNPVSSFNFDTPQIPLSINAVVGNPVSQFNMQPVLSISSTVANPVSAFNMQHMLSINSVVGNPVSAFNMQPVLSISAVCDNAVSNFNFQQSLSIASECEQATSSFNFEFTDSGFLHGTQVKQRRVWASNKKRGQSAPDQINTPEAISTVVSEIVQPSITSLYVAEIKPDGQTDKTTAPIAELFNASSQSAAIDLPASPVDSILRAGSAGDGIGNIAGILESSSGKPLLDVGKALSNNPLDDLKGITEDEFTYYHAGFITLAVKIIDSRHEK